MCTLAALQKQRLLPITLSGLVPPKSNEAVAIPLLGSERRRCLSLSSCDASLVDSCLTNRKESRTLRLNSQAYVARVVSWSPFLSFSSGPVSMSVSLRLVTIIARLHGC